MDTSWYLADTGKQKVGNSVISRAAGAACALLLAMVISTAGCGGLNPMAPSNGHIDVEPVDVAEPGSTTDAQVLVVIPEPVTTAPYLPAPVARPRREIYTVVVNRVPVRELLFALARDAQLNIDIVGDIGGQITINAIDQTLTKILDRIALQAPIRYQVGDNYLLISADLPYLQSYAINYLNMSRSATSRIDLATQIGSISVDLDGAGGFGSNNSQTQVHNSSANHFWDSLVKNIKDLLGVAADGARDPAGNVIVHRESGLLSVRGTSRQHIEIQEFIDRVLASARRQALIEATVVEIALSDTYQAGIDWRVLSKDAKGFAITQSFTGGPAAAANTTTPNFLLSYTDPRAGIGNVLSTLKLLNQFGDVKILSSPKIIALNNQTAVLKVVDNRVYFTISVDPAVTNSSGTITKPATRKTEIHTVPVGFVMNVTPFISAGGEVILNVRPSISRILGFVNDPNPDLATEGVVNRIPEIQVREMESLLRVNSGQVAIIGGLMQDKIDKRSSSVPGLADIPIFGKIFSYRDEQVVKTELLVFLRPTVIDNASLDGDLSRFRQYLLPPEMHGVDNRINPEDS